MVISKQKKRFIGLICITVLTALVVRVPTVKKTMEFKRYNEEINKITEYVNASVESLKAIDESSANYLEEMCDLCGDTKDLDCYINLFVQSEYLDISQSEEMFFLRGFTNMDSEVEEDVNEEGMESTIDSLRKYEQYNEERALARQELYGFEWSGKLKEIFSGLKSNAESFSTLVMSDSVTSNWDTVVTYENALVDIELETMESINNLGLYEHYGTIVVAVEVLISLLYYCAVFYKKDGVY